MSIEEMCSCHYDYTISGAEEEAHNMMYRLGRNCIPSFHVQVKYIDFIRRAGNEMFALQDWTAAMSAYSRFIIMGGGLPLEINGSDENEFNHFLMLAYSKRAEVRLQLQEFEEALRDADKALQITPKHRTALVRKGKAAHGIGLFKKACEAFQAALEVSPELPSVVKLLKKSTTAYEQSRTGNYDVTRCMGEVPSCGDFVGPVEIRRATCGQGGRGFGLFATKSSEPGELLLVSNALAVNCEILENSSPLEAVTDSIQETCCWRESIDNLSRELYYKILRSKRQTAGLYSLASSGKLEVGLPSMKLFTPGSDWIPSGAESLELDMELVSDIAKTKRLQYAQTAAPGKTTNVIGVWLLPAFAKHSCAPNCQRIFVGDTLFLRASQHIMEGDELTIPYFDRLFEDVAIRRELSEHWMFTCECERCVVEKSLEEPQLSKASKVQNDFMDGGLDFLQVVDEPSLAKLEKITKLADEVEAVIQSLSTTLSPKQQGWIRASYMQLYLLKNEEDPVTGPDPQSIISSHRLLVSISSAYVNVPILTVAATLLREVEQLYSKDSPSYRGTLNQVMDIYKVFYGKQTDVVMGNLINGNFPGNSKSDGWPGTHLFT